MHSSLQRFSAGLLVLATTTMSVAGLLAIPSQVHAANTITSSQYLDLDLNGTVDRIRWIMDEDVTACVYEAGDWAVDVASSMNIAITGLECAGANLDILVSADAEETGATVNPSISYTDAVTPGSVTLTSGDLTAKAAVAATDGARPIVIETLFLDPTPDGHIDRIGFETSNDTGLDCAPFIPGTSMNITQAVDINIEEALTDECVITEFEAGRAGFHVNITAGTEYTTASSQDVLVTLLDGAITDGAGNDLVGDDFIASDSAVPILWNITPSSGQTSVGWTSSVVFSFTEPMTEAFEYGVQFTSSHPQFWNDGLEVNEDGNVFTIGHTAFLPCTTISLNLDLDEIWDVNTSQNTWYIDTNTNVSPADGDWSFTTLCKSSSGSGTPAAPTYEAAVTSPNGGEVLAPGTLVDITWTSGGTGIASNADLYLTLDGNSYIEIAKNLPNNGVYSWLVPNVSTDLARIRVELTDLAEVLAVDASDSAFSISTSSASENDTPTQAPISGQKGKSPVTGLEEDISVVNVGDYVKSPFFSTVYYIDSNMVRRPFMDATTYFTWQNSFGAVKIVTDATLPTLTIGAPMLPKAGVVLVKIESDPKTYALEHNPANPLSPNLRWITSESIAISLYGADWADYVVDIEPTFFTKFGKGSDITNASSITVDRSMMKKRVNLR